MAAAWRGVMSASEPLLKASGEPMADKKGDMLRVGKRVVDDMFNLGTVQGTCPVDRGEGFNVQVKWDAPLDEDGQGHEKVNSWC